MLTCRLTPSSAGPLLLLNTPSPPLRPQLDRQSPWAPSSLPLSAVSSRTSALSAPSVSTTLDHAAFSRVHRLLTATLSFPRPNRGMARPAIHRRLQGRQVCRPGRVRLASAVVAARAECGLCRRRPLDAHPVAARAPRHGNRYFENLDETLWRHRWVDFASVRRFRSPLPPPSAALGPDEARPEALSTTRLTRHQFGDEHSTTTTRRR